MLFTIRDNEGNWIARTGSLDAAIRICELAYAEDGTEYKITRK